MVVGLSEVLAGHADARACWVRAGLAALNVPQYERSIVLRHWTCACDLPSSVEWSIRMAQLVMLASSATYSSSLSPGMIDAVTPSPLVQG